MDFCKKKYKNSRKMWLTYSAIVNTCVHGGKLIPFTEKVICWFVRSNRQPRISPDFHLGRG